MDSILNLLRDQIWGFVGALFGLAAIALAYWIFLLQRKVKEISFGILSTRRLFSVDPHIASRITVLFEGRQIGELHLMVIGLKNSGTEPILAADFTQPIIFNANAGTKILSAEITKQSPLNLGFTLKFGESAIHLDSVLLNAGDHVVLQAVLSGSEPTVTSNLRVVGVTAPSTLQTSPLRAVTILTPWQRTRIYLTWLGALASITFIGTDAIKFYTPMKALLFSVLLCILISGPVIILLRERYSRKFRRYIDDA